MTIRFKELVLASVLGSIAAPAMAVDNWHSSLVLSAGRANEKNACASPWAGIFVTSTCSENYNKAYRIAYVYHFTPAWGIETSYGTFGKAVRTGEWVAPGQPATWSMTAEGWTVAGTYTAHISDSFSLFGKAGVARAQFSENINGTINGAPFYGISFNGVPTTNAVKFGLTYGVGLQYDFNSSYALRAQYENFGRYNVYGAYGVASSKISPSMASVGLVLSF